MKIEKIKKLFVKSAVKVDSKFDERVMNDALTAFEKSKESKSAQSQPSVWRKIMKSKITKFAVAAVIIFAVLIGIYRFSDTIDVSTRVFAISDVPELLRTAKTLHIKGFRWVYNDEPNFPNFKNANMVPIEEWIDILNLHSRSITFMTWCNNKGERGLERLEVVLGGNQLQIDINHTRKDVWFNRGTLLDHRLRIRQILDEYASLVYEEQLEGYQKIGQETINGIEYDIWECDSLRTPEGAGMIKLQCWISPESGAIGRIYQWHKPSKDYDTWLPILQVDKIEQNIDIPSEVFAIEIPESYQQHNTPETAPLNELSKGNSIFEGINFEFHVCFMLDNGSVIVAWKSWIQESENQEDLFKNLKPGDELPLLPMVLEKLTLIPDVFRPSGAQQQYSYTGRHLAYTKKGNRFIEWGLYVPIEGTPVKQAKYVYKGHYRLNNKEEQPLREFNPVWGTTISPNEFNTFVLEAMAELSNDGKVPEYITYDNVTKLSEEIRATIKE